MGCRSPGMMSRGKGAPLPCDLCHDAFCYLPPPPPPFENITFPQLRLWAVMKLKHTFPMTGPRFPVVGAHHLGRVVKTLYFANFSKIAQIKKNYFPTGAPIRQRCLMTFTRFCFDKDLRHHGTYWLYTLTLFLFLVFYKYEPENFKAASARD